MKNYRTKLANDLPLKSWTPESWAERVLEDPIGLLNDHAHLERKACNNAMDLIPQWPRLAGQDPQFIAPQWSTELVSIAKDEIEHMELVLKILHERGGYISRGHTSEYGRGLRSLVRKGRGHEELIDRLMVCALIEARSCERFSVLGEVCKDEQLRRLYRGLYASEHSHYCVFIELATFATKDEDAVKARWEEMLQSEADVLARQKQTVGIHSGA